MCETLQVAVFVVNVCKGCEMKAKILIALFAAAGLIWSAGASAKDEGFYLGASAGVASVEVEESDVEFDESDFAWKVFGGYQFNGLFAVEGGYVDFGNPDKDYGDLIGNVDVDVTGFDLFGVVGLPLGPVRAFGKLGGVFWDADVNTDFGSGSDDGTELAAGVGLEFEIFGLGLRGEVEYFDVEDGIYLYTVGATFTF